MMIEEEGGLEGTMMTEMIVVDVGVVPEITEMIIRDKVRPARIGIQGNIEDGDRPRLMMMRTALRPLN